MPVGGVAVEARVSGQDRPPEGAAGMRVGGWVVLVSRRISWSIHNEMRVREEEKEEEEEEEEKEGGRSRDPGHVILCSI